MGFANIQLINGPDIVRPTLELTISTVQNFEVDIQDENGSPVDLTLYDEPDAGPEAAVPCQRGRGLPITNGVQFVAAEFQGQALPSASITCEVVDAANGVINIPITACSFTKPGVYLAEVQLIKDGELRQVFKMYVDAQASLAWVVNGPLTIAEVRLWARDSMPEDNFLLDEMEFKDAEVVAAIRRAVDIWNSTAPVLANYTFTPSNFPFRSQWLDLTLALLYDIAAKSYLRNHLPYSAAGVQVDDKNKYNQYRQMASDERQKYEQWAKDIKLQLNAQQCWGRSNIGYAGGGVTTYGDYFGY